MPVFSDIRDRPAAGQEAWIIGVGNLHRRDDGIGPRTARRLSLSLGRRKDIHVRILHQLVPELIEDLRHAGVILFIDAAVSAGDGGVTWTEISSEPGCLCHVTHVVTPDDILGGIASIYGRRPRAFLISVKGEDFGFGEGLTPPAEARMIRAASEIISFLETLQPFFIGENDGDPVKNHTHHR